MSPYLTPDWEASALLTIDVQEDFTLPGAPALIPGTLECVPAMRRVIEAYRNLRRPIFHVVRLYLPDGSNADLCRREAIERGAAIVHPGARGAELVDALKPDPSVPLDSAILLSGKLQTLGENEWALYKPRWDAFFQTPLEKQLRGSRVNTVVVVGCNFPNCPRATLYGASMRDFRLVLVTDAVSGVYEKGLEELRRIGVTTCTSDEFVRAFAARA